MECVDDPDVETFAARVLDWMGHAPVANSRLRAVLEARLAGRAVARVRERWIRVLDAGALVGVVIWTRPGVPLLSPMPVGAAETAARHLAPDGPTGVSGPVPAVDAFARASCAAPRVRMDLGVFALHRVIPPARAAPGRLRQVTAADRAVVARWWRAFVREALPNAPEPDVDADLDSRVGRDGLLWLWEDGGPATLVGASPMAGGVIRIAPVYTPPELRERGYASAAVAGVSQWALDTGAVAVSLCTDLANPTSNSVYRRLGYERVGDAREWELSR